MNDLGYVVAFNILDAGYRQWTFPAFGLFVTLFAITIVSIAGRIKRQNAIPLILVLGTLGTLWVLGTFAVTFSDYSYCADALKSDKASYVEGRIDDFVPMPRSGHGVESFTVNGVPFSYSDFIATAGFNTTNYSHGPMRQGLPVRIWYVGNEIVKLEYKK